VIGSLGDKAEEADTKAKKAIADSSTALSQAKDALTKSGEAAESLGKAEDEASKAQTASSNALTLAHDARQEADSFEKDIVSAKKQATEAEAHLAEARQLAANAAQGTAAITAELADRTLTDEQVKSIADKLKFYAGQEYDITPYRDSKESVGIAERIFLALRLAKWKFLPSKAIGLFGGVVGVQVWRHPDADEQTKAAAAGLVAALLHEGIQAELQVQNSENNPKHSIISLNVGAKR
jgi:hypothetical protein